MHNVGLVSSGCMCWSTRALPSWDTATKRAKGQVNKHFVWSVSKNCFVSGLLAFWGSMGPEIAQSPLKQVADNRHAGLGVVGPFQGVEASELGNKYYRDWNVGRLAVLFLVMDTACSKCGPTTAQNGA